VSPPRVASFGRQPKDSVGCAERNPAGGCRDEGTGRPERPGVAVTGPGWAADAGGFATSTLRITNHSSKPSNYMVTVTFESPDGATQVGTGLAAVNSLQPAQSTVQDVSSLAVPAGAFVCKVNPTGVTRYAA